MAKWYDPFLTKDERHLQVGQKGIRARRRMQDMGINTAEPKRVPTVSGQSVSRASKADTIRQNARQVIRNAMSAPTNRGVMFNSNGNKENRRKGK